MLSLIRACVGCNKHGIIKNAQKLRKIDSPSYIGVLQPNVARRCLSTEDGQEKKDENSTSQQKNPFQKRHALPGQTRFVSPRKKRLLMISGRWKSVEDIPDVITEGRYNGDMWVVRIRLATFMMVLWVISCVFVTDMARKKRKEQTHQLVMEQYLEGLPKAERDRLREQYNLQPERINK